MKLLLFLRLYIKNRAGASKKAQPASAADTSVRTGIDTSAFCLSGAPSAPGSRLSKLVCQVACHLNVKVPLPLSSLALLAMISGIGPLIVMTA
jgi:hypothetical protein